MAKYNLTWQATDARFLEALLLATGGEGAAPLQEILLMADAIDGTVYTLNELEASLEKLTAVKFVQVEKNKLALTTVFMQAYEGVSESEDLQEVIVALLHANTLTEQSIENAKVTLKKYKLKNYYQQYQEQYG